MGLELAEFHNADSADKAAVIMAESGDRLTFSQLGSASSQAAHLLQALGLEPGDRVAVCLTNSLEFFPIVCGIIRAGLFAVPISTKLTAQEIEYIVRDSGAKVVITSPLIGSASGALPGRLSDLVLFSAACEAPGFRDWVLEREAQPNTPLAPLKEGGEVLYSSGTTGRPKGIKRDGALPPGGLSVRTAQVAMDLNMRFDAIYLSPAPLYHSAPFGWSLALLRLGATVVVMDRFDAEAALAAIETYRVTHSQWVPTHFVRLLKLDSARRSAFDLSSHALALHAAAPCPVSVKRAMIDWWGPILVEFYGSTEQSILTMINSADWLFHPGSVGRCMRGTLHICDEAGEDLPPQTPGQVYCDGGVLFEYGNNPEKNAQSRHANGWTTVGDIGYLDQEGYLFLTDRKDFMIISGGVNIYPQELEDLLVGHPKVADAAVIGTPDEDLGEKVTALVQLIDPADGTPEFARELRDWMRQSISAVKTPKLIVFRAELPRLPTGKMVKHLLRAEYAEAG
jgi:long-chain acyl-CoA synthetase